MGMFNFEDIFDLSQMTKKKTHTIKDIADKYPDPPKEKVIETTCPHCGKKLRMKIRV